MRLAPPSLPARWSSAARPLGVALLLMFSVVAALAVVPAAHASTTISITTTNGMSGCAAMGGSWDGTTYTCTAAAAGFTVSSGYTLDVGAGVTLVSSNAFSNDGTVTNHGSITGSATVGGGINNYGTLTNYATLVGVGAGGSGCGVYNSGTLVNYATLDGSSSTSGCGRGIDNAGALDNGVGGALNGVGTGTIGTGIYNTGTVNNDGSLAGSGSGTATSSTSGGGLDNQGTVNDYCFGTLLWNSFYGNAPLAWGCNTLTLYDNGIPAGVSWGVTIAWPFGTTRYTSTTGSLSVTNLGGSVNFTFDASVAGSGTTYFCGVGCSGTPSIRSAASFTAGYAPPLVSITAANGASTCGSGMMLGSAWNGALATCSAGASGFNVPNGVTLDVGPQVSLSTSYGFTNHGVTDNNGTVTASGPDVAITNTGTINNYGTVLGSSSSEAVSNLGTINNYASFTGAAGGAGINNGGTINNKGSLVGGSTDVGSTTGEGIVSTGTINNYGSVIGTSTGIGTGTSLGPIGTVFGIDNAGTLNNAGSVEGEGYDAGILTGPGAINNEGSVNGSGTGPGPTGYGISNGGTINNDGSVNGTSKAGFGYDIFDWDGIVNGTFNNYCGAAITDSGAYVTGHPANFISCSTVAFGGTGLPAGVTWGVTVTWGPFILPQDHTGTGTSIAVPITGSLSYSFDTPVTGSGMTYDCTTGCTGTASITSSTSFSAGYVNPNAASTGTAVLCSSTGIDVGVPVTCGATVTGFIGTITGDTVTFSQLGGTGGVSFPSGATCTLTSAGACATPVTVDGASIGTATVQAAYAGDPNNLASSGITALSVSPAMIVSLSPSSASVAANGSTSATFTVTVLGGAGIYSYSWAHTGLGASSGCTSTDSTCTVTASSPGTYSVSVTVSDTQGGTASPAPAEVIAAAPSSFKVIPSTDTPPTLSLTTYGSSSVSGSFVGMLGPSEAVYNVPSINQALLSQQLSQGDFSSFPNAINTCLTQIDGQSYVRVSGFFDVWWGGTTTNSTEFVFSGWDSYLTPAQGWPAEPSCS